MLQNKWLVGSREAYLKKLEKTYVRQKEKKTFLQPTNKKTFSSIFTDPVLLKTTTTRSPLPPWFPLTSPTSSFDKNQKLRENATKIVLSPNNGSSLHDSSRSGSIFEPSAILATTDCPDPEHNNCGNSHWVKVPKVPYDYDYIKNNSKPHFPIDLPGDNSNHHEDHDIDFEQNSERSNEAQSSTPSPKKPTVSIQVLPNFTQYCPPARSRNLFWNWTLAVSVFYQFH